MQNKINLKAYLSAADKFWIGGQLRSLRQAQGLGVPEVARLANCPQSQILAIESGSQGPFGNTENYVMGILNYADKIEIAPDSALGVKLAELANITDGALKDETSASGINSLMQSSLTNGSAASQLRGVDGKRVALVAAGLCAILLAVLLALDILPGAQHIKSAMGLSPKLKDTTEHQTAITENTTTAATQTKPQNQTTLSTPPEPSTEKPNVSATQKTETATKSQATDQSLPKIQEQATRSTASLSFKFSGSCWVQITGLDGKVSEKVYGNSDQLELDPSKVKSLVIGNVEAVTVTNSLGKQVNLKPFANQISKVARFKEQDLGTLIRDRN